MNILVVEDNDALRKATVAMLLRNGHAASGLVCAEDVDDIRLDPPPDLFIIDLNLPGEDGLSLAQRLRAAQPLVGIIMVTARSLLGDRLAGYEHGADIYLPKPADPGELLAAIESLGRRLMVQSRKLDEEAGPVCLRLDQASRMLHGPSASVALSVSEVAVLAGLSRAQAHRLETWQIMGLVGEDPSSYTKASLEVRMVRLRKKLIEVGGSPRCLPSLRGFGYQLGLSIRLL